ncbi:hypothetical protein [Pseudomonas cichorii]|uniref:hypothetical protein n=1 Tax=Pseudomonas cichorii TaxID=36746 RepID=UPI001C893D02|nr:hypothetical protein [Pseudomonas cichorii]MBX8574798.1 hypothetical protein [Pseudomonas cichorii]
MDSLMDTFVKAAPGSIFRVEEKSGSVSFVYEGELKSVDVEKNTIGIMDKYYKGKIYTVSVGNIIRVNGREAWDMYSIGPESLDRQSVIAWMGDEWYNEYTHAQGFDMDTAFSRIPEGAKLILPGYFCGTQQPQQAALKLVDYEADLAVLDSITSPGQIVKVPMNKVASVDNGVIKPVA